MIFNGKYSSNWFGFTWTQFSFRSFFTGQSNTDLLSLNEPCFKLVFLCLILLFLWSCMIPGFETAVVYYTYQYMPCHQGYLNTLASWAVAGGPHEHWDPLLIYICCDLLSIKKYCTILNYKYLFLCYKLDTGIHL